MDIDFNIAPSIINFRNIYLNGLPVSWSVVIQLRVYFEVLKYIFVRMHCYFRQNNISVIRFTHTVRALGHIGMLYFPELSN